MKYDILRIPAICLIMMASRPSSFAAEFFSSPEQRKAFEKALEDRDKAYDPTEKMIRRPFSSPGYHTTLKGGYVHPTRDSLQYAIALLDSGEEGRLERACDIIRKVISLQDEDPESRTYGIWSWFMEEPLEKMSPPDWNWADFCGTQLLQAAIDHADRVPDDLREEIKASIIHAANSIKKRNVGPGYTNIALMGTYVTLAAGDLYDNTELLEYGRSRLRRFWEYTNEHGSFSEYNSPTYTVVAINEITRMLRHVKDPASRDLIEKLNSFAWLHLARRFHPPTRQWSGPHSRCYSTLLRTSSLAFIQRATGGKLQFLPESEAFESLDAHRLEAKCPDDFLHYFTDLPAPRLEIETFDKSGAAPHDIVGTTYLDPDFTLGSVNIGDLWNQRRPLLAYWKTDTGVAAMRFRCLHDDYDYSSASIFTVQDKANILGAVVFATDRGDTHISLDRIKDATITAKDLRLRLQLEGEIDGTMFAAHAPDNFDRPFTFTSGPIKVEFGILHAVFDDYPIISQFSRDAKGANIDIILYKGPEKKINFAGVNEAAIIFTLAMNPRDEDRRARIEHRETSIATSWKNMILTIPAKPTRTKDQRKEGSASLNAANPWLNKPKKS